MANDNQRISILIADHDRWTRCSISAPLEEAGFAVYEASNGMAALRTAVSRRPHLVMLGSGLSEVASSEVLATLRSNPRTRHAAIVEISPAAPWLHVDGCLSLPSNAIELLATVASALEARHAAESPTQSASAETSHQRPRPSRAIGAGSSRSTARKRNVGRSGKRRVSSSIAAL